MQCDILLSSVEESAEVELRYIAVLSYYDESGQRRQKRRTSFSFSEAKRIRRELEDEYLEGGEVNHVGPVHP